jgi:hypothetical protein
MMLVIGMIGLFWGTFASIIVLSGILAIAFMRRTRGGPTLSLLRAERIVIVNQKGVPRACLDSAGLQLTDDVGHPRIVIAVDNDGPAFQVWDKDAKLQLSLGSGANGTGLSLLDVETGKIRGQAMVYSGKLGFASFAVRDSSGCVRGFFTSSVDGDGGARLSFLDKSGSPVCSIDETGKPVGSVP